MLWRNKDVYNHNDDLEGINCASVFAGGLRTTTDRHIFSRIPSSGLSK